MIKITLLRVIPTMSFIRFVTGKSSDILSGISFWHSIWHIFWHSIWYIFWHSIWHAIWHIFLHEVRQGTLGVDARGWGPAGNTGRGWSWLRSGREHWAGMVAVEVRQGTLSMDGRGWGPTENTVDRGSQLDEEDEEDDEEEEERRWGGEERRGGAGNWHKI